MGGFLHLNPEGQRCRGRSALRCGTGRFDIAQAHQSNYHQCMEFLVLAFIAVCAFVGLAPKPVVQLALTLTWAGMAFLAVISVLRAAAILMFN